jgi:hypothetical protein
MQVILLEEESRDAFSGGGYSPVGLVGNEMELDSRPVELLARWTRKSFLGRVAALSAEINLQLHYQVSAGKGVFCRIKTLCIPTQEAWRNTATTQMARVYQAINHVLVLAAERLPCPRPSTPAEVLFGERSFMDDARSISADRHHLTVL